MIRVFDVQEGLEMAVRGAEELSDEKVVSKAHITSPAGVIIDGTTARTLAAGDNGRPIYFTSATDVTLTMAAGLGAGFAVTVIQGGAGEVIFAAGGQTMLIAGGLTKTSGPGAMAVIIAPVANTFVISGTLA